MYQLSIEQEFNVPVERLFAAWVEPENIQKWFAPGSMTVPEASADLKVGGEYRIVMEDDDGEQFIVGGVYEEIVPNERLAFTWKWEDGENTTKVTVTFKDLGDQRSVLSLSHTEFVEQEHCDKHYEGWIGCLANLPKAV